MLELNKKKEIIIIGYSGHSYEIIDTIINQGLKIKGYTDLSKKKNNPYKLEYLGDENKEDFKYLNDNYIFFIAIGDNLTRKNKSDFLDYKGLIQINVIHPDSSISKSTKMGVGNFISRNVSINNSVEIGNSVVINTAAIIEHDCKILDGVHVAPGAVLCGGVTVNKNSFIGANSVINQNIIIGEVVTIGSGSVVIRDLANGFTAYGNPAKSKS